MPAHRTSQLYGDSWDAAEMRTSRTGWECPNREIGKMAQNTKVHRRLLAGTAATLLALGGYLVTGSPAAQAADPLLTGISKTPKAKEDLDVMTFNERDATLDTGDGYTRRRDVLAEAIFRELPDLIGTQEGVKWQQDNLWVDLKNKGHQYEWYGDQREFLPDNVQSPDQGETVGIFYNPDRLEDKGHGDFWFCTDKPGLSGDNRKGCVSTGDGWKAGSPRMATWIHFRDKVTNKEFYAVNTHLDLVRQAKDLGANKVLDHMAEINKRNLPVVLTGDFNSRDFDTAHQIFTDAGYVDAWNAAKNKGEEFKSLRGDQEPTPGFRIDHILTKPAATVSGAVMSTIKDGNGVYPSDHLPVLARIRLP